MELNNLIPDLDLPEIEVDLVEETDPIQETDESHDQEKIEETSTFAEDADEKAIAFYDELKERGYTFNDDKFDGTWDSLDDYFNNLPQAVLNSVVDTLPDVSKDVMRFIATAGNNISTDEMKKFFEDYFEDQKTASTNVETLDSAREYLEEYYKQTGIKPKAIQSMLDSLEDDDELIDTAKEIFEKNKETKTSKLIEQKAAENQQKQEQTQQFVSNIQKELTSTGWKPERVNKITQVLSGNTFSTKLQEITTNPKALIQLADLLTYYSNGEFNLDAFKKQMESNPTKSLKDKLKESQFSSGTSRTSSTIRKPDPQEELIPVMD